jgi:alanine dehydrogenase
MTDSGLPFISEAAVAEVLTVSDAILVIDRVMRDQAAGLAENSPRQRLRVGEASLHMLAASWEGGGVYGQKVYSVGPGGSQFWVLLYHSDGRPFALVEAQRLGQIRTGAATGVATRALARDDSRRVGVIGSGYQMRTQLEAVCSVRPIDEVLAWSPNAQRLEIFCREMSKRLGIPVRPAPSPGKAVAGADVVITLTTAHTPLLTAEDVQAGMHLNVAGSNHPDRREVDSSLIARASSVVTDDVDQARVESGDLIAAVTEGALQWETVQRLAEVVVEPKLGRGSGEDVSLFKSHGIGLWDVATAAWVAEMAVAAGLARSIDIASGPDSLAPQRFGRPA